MADKKPEKEVGVVYRGPSPSVRVPPYGRHYKGKTIKYPEAFAVDLVETGKKQNFEMAGK